MKLQWKFPIARPTTTFNKLHKLVHITTNIHYNNTVAIFNKIQQHYYLPFEAIAWVVSSHHKLQYLFFFLISAPVTILGNRMHITNNKTIPFILHTFFLFLETFASSSSDFIFSSNNFKCSIWAHFSTSKLRNTFLVCQQSLGSCHSKNDNHHLSNDLWISITLVILTYIRQTSVAEHHLPKLALPNSSPRIVVYMRWIARVHLHIHKDCDIDNVYSSLTLIRLICNSLLDFSQLSCEIQH